MKTRTRKRATRPNAVESGEIPPPKRAASPFVKLPPGWKSGADVIDAVTSVRTCFLDFNRGVRVGGLPTRRIHTVTGKTHGGKTAFVMGLVRSFVSAGHVGGYIDAEHATPKQFAEEVLGSRLEDLDNLIALRPSSYEETFDALISFLDWVAALRAKGVRARDGSELCSIAVVDSVNKLTPKREMANLLKDGGKAADKGWGRYRANLNQALLDHLVPLLAAANCALVLIAQLRKEDGTEAWEMPHIKGGAALAFDASLIVEVDKARPMLHGDGKDAVTYGFRHRVRTWKSKVGQMDGRWDDSYFHLSNGVYVPPGLDLARDAVYVGKNLGAIKGSGSWLSWGRRRWNGEHLAVSALAKDGVLYRELFDDVSSRIDIAAGRGT